MQRCMTIIVLRVDVGSILQQDFGDLTRIYIRRIMQRCMTIITLRVDGGSIL